MTDYNGTLEMNPSETEFDYTYVSGRLDTLKTKDDIRPYLLMKNDETGDAEYHALFRTNEADVSCYVRTDEIDEGSYSLFLVYEQDGKCNVSGKLGEYITGN